MRVAHKLVTYAVDSAEVRRVPGVSLQLLPKLQNVVVHRARRRIVLITPDFIQQLIARDHPLGILQKKFQRLEFLRGHSHRFRRHGRLPSW